jgi:hypothetical protein
MKYASEKSGDFVLRALNRLPKNFQHWLFAIYERDKFSRQAMRSDK